MYATRGSVSSVLRELAVTRESFAEHGNRLEVGVGKDKGEARRKREDDAPTCAGSAYSRRAQR